MVRSIRFMVYLFLPIWRLLKQRILLIAETVPLPIVRDYRVKKVEEYSNSTLLPGAFWNMCMMPIAVILVQVHDQSWDESE